MGKARSPRSAQVSPLAGRCGLRGEYPCYPRPFSTRASRRAGAEAPGEKMEGGDVKVVEKPVSPVFFGGGSFGRVLKDIEQRYSDAFAEVGPGSLRDFKHLVDCIEGFFDLLADPKTDFRVKLMDYAKVKADVAEFCRYYARWLGRPLMERLKHEIYEVLEEAMDWWGRQHLIGGMEGL